MQKAVRVTPGIAQMHTEIMETAGVIQVFQKTEGIRRAVQMDMEITEITGGNTGASGNERKRWNGANTAGNDRKRPGAAAKAGTAKTAGGAAPKFAGIKIAALILAGSLGAGGIHMVLWKCGYLAVCP